MKNFFTNLASGNGSPEQLMSAVKNNNIEEVTRLLDNGIDVNTSDSNSGNTLLHWASLRGYEAIATLLANRGARINEKNYKDITPLHQAVKRGHVKIAKMLINRKADIDAKNVDGETPLFDALNEGHEEIVKLLIAKGADVNGKNVDGETPLHHAVNEGREEIVKLLIAKGADINAKDIDDATPIHHAVNKAHEEIVKLLIAKGVDINVKNNFGITPLDYALGNGNTRHTKIVKFLIDYTLENGYKEKVKFYIDHALENGCTETATLLINHVLEYIPTEKLKPSDFKTETTSALHLSTIKRLSEELILAAKNSNIVEARRLIDEGADVNAKDSENVTPLFYAIKESFEKLVKLLIARGANINVRSAKVDLTPLHMASFECCFSIAELLIAEGANVDAKALCNITPLHAAAASSVGSKEIAELLITKGANVNARINNKKKLSLTLPMRHDTTPLHCAAEQGHAEIAELLITNGASINAKDSDNKTPIDYALEKGHTEIVTFLKAKKGVVDASHPSRTETLSEALISAAKESDIKEVKRLINEGANVNSKDSENLTPLHCASVEDSKELIDLLLNEKADINARSIRGMTPLHIASMLGSKEAVKLLIAKGADVNVEDSDNKTPFDHASEKEKGYAEIAQLLRANKGEALNQVYNVKDQVISSHKTVYLAIQQIILSVWVMCLNTRHLITDFFQDVVGNFSFEKEKNTALKETQQKLPEEKENQESLAIKPRSRTTTFAGDENERKINRNKSPQEVLFH